MFSKFTSQLPSFFLTFLLTSSLIESAVSANSHDHHHRAIHHRRGSDRLDKKDVLGIIPSTAASDGNATADPKVLKDAVNTVLEQAVGILPPTVVEKIESGLTPILDPLLPAPLQALTSQLSSSILSVTASLSGNLVTAAEKLENCLLLLFHSSNPTQTLQTSATCIISNLTVSPLEGENNILNALNGVFEQFLGYFPPNAVDDILAEVSPVLDQLPTKNVTKDLENSMRSWVATLSGNSVTAAELLEPCVLGLVYTKGERQGLACLKPVLDTALVLVNGLLEQLFGVLAPNLVLDLQDLTYNYLTSSKSKASSNSSSQEEIVQTLLTKFRNHFTQLSQSIPTFLEKDGGLEKCLTKGLVGGNLKEGGKDCNILAR